MAAMPRALIDDCFAPGQELLRHDEAIALLRERVTPIASVQRLALVDAVGRVLAEPAVAGTPVPAHTNSAVDGYAFAHAEQTSPDQFWPVAGRAAAGHPFRGEKPAGSIVRIFTGAVLPPSTDTVVMQEDAEVGPDGAVRFSRGLKRGANVRLAGEDVKAGEALLAAGETIRPQDLAALASIGLGEAACFAPLRVAIVSTGDEIVRPGSRPLEPGEVYDANAPMLHALATAAGAHVTHLGIWRDDQGRVREGLAEAAARFDVILTSGGASRGEEDHMASAIGALGQRHFWQILVKPGRPMMLGQIGDCVVVGLPGNPVAVFVCFLMYAWPMLRRLGGAAWPEPRRLMLPAAFTFPKRKVGRRELWRGTLREVDGTLQVAKFERDGSGLISSLRAADCLIDIPEDVPEIRLGDPVAVIPFSEYGIVR